MKLLRRIISHTPRSILYGIIVYITILTLLSILKYHFFLYDGLDLAIFNQTFWNTVHGRWFDMTVTFPHKYLGDHTGIWLILYLPIYFVFRHPITLLVIQSIVLSLATIPIYHIGKKIFKEEKYALFWSMLWLLNPYVWNANLFEFHIITIYPLLIFSTVYLYLTKRKWWFFTLLTLTILTREDMGITTLGLSLIIMIDYLKRYLPSPSRSINLEKNTLKNTLSLIVPHVVLAVLWTIIAYQIVGVFSGAPSTRFVRYYAWLGDGIPEILGNTLTRPLAILTHILSKRNLDGFIGVLLPFCFISLYRPKWLLLSTIPLGAMFLISSRVDTIVFLSLHYILTILPGFFLSAMYGYGAIIHRIPRYDYLLSIILVVSTIYTFVVLGPLSSPDLTDRLAQSRYRRAVWSEHRDDFSYSDRVIADLPFLPQLSSREYIYSSDQIYIGTLEFSDILYPSVCNIGKTFLTTPDTARMIAKYGGFPLASLDNIRESLTCSRYDHEDIYLDDSLATDYLTIATPRDMMRQLIDTRLISQKLLSDKLEVILSTDHTTSMSESDLLWRIEVTDTNSNTYAVIAPYDTSTSTLTITSRRFLDAYRKNTKLNIFIVENRATNYIDILQSTHLKLEVPTQVYGYVETGN